MSGDENQGSEAEAFEGFKIQTADLFKHLEPIVKGGRSGHKCAYCDDFYFVGRMNSTRVKNHFGGGSGRRDIKSQRFCRGAPDDVRAFFNRSVKRPKTMPKSGSEQGAPAASSAMEAPVLHPALAPVGAGLPAASGLPPVPMLQPAAVLQPAPPVYARAEAALPLDDYVLAFFAGEGIPLWKLESPLFIALCRRLSKDTYRPPRLAALPNSTLDHMQQSTLERVQQSLADEGRQ